jgi:exopolysaccharide biosynthesis protein
MQGRCYRRSWSNDSMPLRSCLVLVCLLALAPIVPAQQAALGSAESIAEGVQLYRLDDPELLSPAGPVAVQALRIGLGSGAEPPRETVDVIAVRRPGTLAAINAGFFSLQSGRPTDLLKVDGRVVNGTSRPRGAVGILERRGLTTLVFDRVIVETRGGVARYQPQLGSSARDWARAPDAISGAGLLMLDGREITDWTAERITAGFDTTRHPRTLIGTDATGAIWLVTVDGRSPTVSLGMSFTELQRLARRLGLRSALNLDGGGSTTMWVAGRIVNRPSDPGGPRKVSDAILVVPR